MKWKPKFFNLRMVGMEYVAVKLGTIHSLLDKTGYVRKSYTEISFDSFLVTRYI